MSYNDPTILHPGECSCCLKEVRDADVLTDTLCSECATEIEADDTDEDDNDAYAFVATDNRFEEMTR